MLLLLLGGISTSFASNGEEIKLQEEEITINMTVAAHLVKGKAKWQNETTLRCKGRKGNCAIYWDDGWVYVFSVYVGGSDTPPQEILVESFEVIEGEEEGEPVSDFYIVPYQGDE